MNIIHDSHLDYFRSPFGAVPINTKVTLKVITGEKRIDHIYLVTNRELHVSAGLEQNDIEEIEKEIEKEKEIEIEMELELELSNSTINSSEYVYKAEITMPNQIGWVWYYFKVVDQGKVFYYGKNKNGLGGRGTLMDTPFPYQITVYNHELVSSYQKWFREGIIYQIFVDRFYNGNKDGLIHHPKRNSFIYSHWDDSPMYIRNQVGQVVRWDFFGGNLLGIKKKLGYLKELGISIIYLNPIFEAVSNHKYDTADYMNVDSMFGDNQLFADLCDKAQELGISIIIDGVFSHTGSDSIYFNKDGKYPSLGAYQSKDSPYYAWYRFKQFPNEYESWWGIETLPNVNELDPSYLQFIIEGENSVLKHWHHLGIKGWRLDVADELPDPFIQTFRRKMQELDPSSIVIGEVWEDASNKISYEKRRGYLLGNKLDSVTNYPFRNILLDFIQQNKTAEETHLALMTLFENYPKAYFFQMTNLIGSHDVPRILTVLQEDISADWPASRRKKIAIERLKLAVIWQMTFPGVPLIYYGDEAGLEGGSDPENRATYPWGKENEEILSWYKKIIAIRDGNQVFKHGEWLSIYQDEDVYGYFRFLEGIDKQIAIVLLNRSMEQTISLNINIDRFINQDDHVWFNALDTQQIYQTIDHQLKVSLGPLEGKVILNQ